MSNHLLTRIAEYMIIPPSSSLVLIVLGLLLLLYLRKTGWIIAAAGALTLYLASIPAVSQALIGELQDDYDVLFKIPEDAGAIIVLGGDMRREAREFGGDTVGTYTLERIRYAARLHRETGLPILTSGGAAYYGADSGAAIMARVLEKEFRVPVRWLDDKSGTTHENALHSADILKEQGIDHVLVVTHAWHMPRALWSFEKAGIEATAAPTGFDLPDATATGTLAYIPRYQALAATGVALHEWLGLLWYRWQFGSGTAD